MTMITSSSPLTVRTALPTDDGGGSSVDGMLKVGVGATVVASLAGAGVLLLTRRSAAGGIVEAGAGLFPGRSAASRVVGVVDGVELLSNPRLPRDAPGVTWAEPPGTLFGTGPEGAVSVSHIDQGDLGDCWLLGPMGAIARHDPDRIASTIRPSTDGRHVIVDLPDRSIAVTSELPMLDGEPAFAASDVTDPVNWPAYLEKAHAALAPNGYRSFDGGYAEDGFRMLLGARPIERDPTRSMLAELHASLRRSEPVTISTRALDDLDDEALRSYDDTGLMDSHVYVVDEISGTGDERQVMLLNPHGIDHPGGIFPDELEGLFDVIDTPRHTLWY